MPTRCRGIGATTIGPQNDQNSKATALRKRHAQAITLTEGPTVNLDSAPPQAGVLPGPAEQDD